MKECILITSNPYPVQKGAKPMLPKVFQIYKLKCLLYQDYLNSKNVSSVRVTGQSTAKEE